MLSQAHYRGVYGAKGQELIAAAGFSGTPQETRELMNALATQATLEYKVKMVRLWGVNVQKFGAPKLLVHLVWDNLNWGNRRTQGGGSTTDITTGLTLLPVIGNDAAPAAPAARPAPPKNPAGRNPNTLYQLQRVKLAPTLPQPPPRPEPARRQNHPKLASEAARAAERERLQPAEAALEKRVNSELTLHALTNTL